jgi:hypothetical protein
MSTGDRSHCGHQPPSHEADAPTAASSSSSAAAHAPPHQLPHAFKHAILYYIARECVQRRHPGLRRSNGNALAHPRPKAVTRLRSPAYSSPPPCARHTRLPSRYPRYQSFHIDISNVSRTHLSRRTPCPRVAGASNHHRTKLMPPPLRRLRPALPSALPRSLTTSQTLSRTIHCIMALSKASAKTYNSQELRGFSYDTYED